MVLSANIPALLEHVVPWTLVLCRVSGLFLAAPLLTSTLVTGRFKVLLAVMIAAAAYPALVPLVRPVVVTDVFGLVPMIFSELLIGFAIGSIAALPLLMMELAGVLAGTTMGLGLAKVFNPETNLDTDLLGQMFFFIGSALFISLGGLEWMFAGVLNSFDNVPLGVLVTGDAPLTAFMGVLNAGFELGLRVAAPVVALVLAIVVVIGLLGKTMPQLNVMTVGFSIKLLAGFAMLAWSIYAVRQPLGDEVARALQASTGWIEAFTGSGGR